MANYAESKKVNNPNSAWSWFKRIINQVDIDDTKANEFKGVSPEEKASLMMGERLANEALVTYTGLCAKSSSNKGKINGLNQVKVMNNANIKQNATKSKSVKYINVDRDARVR